MSAYTVKDAASVTGLEFGEVVPADEAGAIHTITRVIEDKVRATARADPPARRDAHPKAHGCVQAAFRVLDDLPAPLRAGVFAKPGTFPAWVRFSNGSDKPASDSPGDGRGMAVKLMGVSDSPSTTQDFLMINYPAFFVRNAADYVDFQTAPNIKKFFFPGLNPFHFRLKEMFVARAIANQTVTNPLNIRYWSMTPCRIGDVACKFSVRPRTPLSRFNATNTPHFLRANMAAQLAEADVSFDFMVQLRTQPGAMPVEDPTTIWNESAAPFTSVATITIPKQVFDTPAQNAFCENLSFTPWHCVTAHQPLGGINRVRRTVYETISRVRHELNAEPRREPTDFKI
jgi:catalase